MAKKRASIAGIPFAAPQKTAVKVPKLKPSDKEIQKAKSSKALDVKERRDLMKYRRILGSKGTLGNYQRKRYASLEERVRLNRINRDQRSQAAKATSRKAKSRDGKATRIKTPKKAKKSVRKHRRSKK